MKRLINVNELFDIVNSGKDYIILDCRFDLMDKNYGPDSYKKGHIKGAYLIDLENQLADPKMKHGGRHPFKNHKDLKEILESFAITNDTIVIAYDDGDMQGAARLVFQLNNLGLYNVYALDGGLLSYKNHGGKVENKINTANFEKSKLDINIDNSFIVDMDYVKSKLYDKNTVLIDSRAKNRYLGLEEPVDNVAGHIPSAKSYFFMDVLDTEKMSDSNFKSSFKSVESLKDHFSDIEADKEIIVYCGSGISLMVNALALDIIDRPYKIYPGSFSDWISYEENKIETKDE